jgi:hypothetical protein
MAAGNRGRAQGRRRRRIAAGNRGGKEGEKDTYTHAWCMYMHIYMHMYMHAHAHAWCIPCIVRPHTMHEAICIVHVHVCFCVEFEQKTCPSERRQCMRAQAHVGRRPPSPPSHVMRSSSLSIGTRLVIRFRNWHVKKRIAQRLASSSRAKDLELREITSFLCRTASTKS